MWSGKRHLNKEGIPIALLVPKQQTRQSKTKLKKLQDAACTCQIGGGPTFFPHDDRTSSLFQNNHGYFCCCICKDPLLLIVQIYAPIDSLHRTLHVLACNRASCRTKPEQTIRCFRSQQPEHPPPSQPSCNIHQPNNNTHEEEDDDDYWADTSNIKTDSATSLHEDLEAMLLKCEEQISRSKQKVASVGSSSTIITAATTTVKNNNNNHSSTCPTFSLFPKEFPLCELEWMDEPVSSQLMLSNRSNALPKEDMINNKSNKNSAVSRIEQMLQRYLQEEEDLELVATLKHYEQNQTNTDEEEDEDDEEEEEDIAGDSSLSPDLSIVNRIKRVPQQVVRYGYDGEVMWSTSGNNPLTIPKCPCGAERKFEFQLMPYLLDLLQKDVEQPNNDKDDKHPQIGGSNAMPGDEGMSWGTIAVYSCCQSCDVSRQEYVVVHKETIL